MKQKQLGGGLGLSLTYHGELAGVVGVVVPVVVLQVPGVETSGESDQPIPVLSPDAESKDDLVVPEMGVVVHGENGLRLDGVVRLEPVVQAVLCRPDDLDRNANVRPAQLRRRRILSVDGGKGRFYFCFTSFK